MPSLLSKFKDKQSSPPSVSKVKKTQISNPVLLSLSSTSTGPSTRQVTNADETEDGGRLLMNIPTTPPPVPSTFTSRSKRVQKPYLETLPEHERQEQVADWHHKSTTPSDIVKYYQNRGVDSFDQEEGEVEDEYDLSSRHRGPNDSSRTRESHYSTATSRWEDESVRQSTSSVSSRGFGAEAGRGERRGHAHPLASSPPIPPMPAVPDYIPAKAPIPFVMPAAHPPGPGLGVDSRPTPRLMNAVPATSGAVNGNDNGHSKRDDALARGLSKRYAPFGLVQKSSKVQMASSHALELKSASASALPTSTQVHDYAVYRVLETKTRSDTRRQGFWLRLGTLRVDPKSLKQMKKSGIGVDIGVAGKTE